MLRSTLLAALGSCSLLLTPPSATAKGTRDTATYRRLRASLDAVAAIDTHDHLWPFDQLPGYVETEHGRGMNRAGQWHNSYYRWVHLNDRIYRNYLDQRWLFEVVTERAHIDPYETITLASFL